MRALVIGLVTGIAACGSDAIAPEGVRDVNRNPGGLTPSAAAMLGEIGCTTGGRPDTGSIAIPIEGARPIILHCKGVPKPLVNQARREYYAAYWASIPGAHTEAGYWEYDYSGSREYCWGTGTWGNDGEFHLVEGTELWGCFWVSSFRPRWVSILSPDYDPNYQDPWGNSGSGSPATGDPEPTPPTLMSVTISPSNATIDIGGSQDGFTVTAHYSDQSSRLLADSAVTWGTSEELSFGTPGRRVNGNVPGVGTVYASFEGKSAQAPVAVRDTLCKTASGETIVGVLNTPMGDLSIQQALWAMADGQQASANKFERGGVVVRHPNGLYSWIERQGDAATNACSFGPAGQYQYTPASGDVVVAYVHSHVAPGTMIQCSSTSAPQPALAGPSRPDDYTAATNRAALGYADLTYVVDPTAIYRVDVIGGVAIFAKQWNRSASPTSCAVPVP